MKTELSFFVNRSFNTALTNSEDHFKCGFPLTPVRLQWKLWPICLTHCILKVWKILSRQLMTQKSFPAAFGILGSEKPLETQSQ